MNITKFTKLLVAVGLIAGFGTTGANAQSTYTADWSTLTGSLGTYNVSMVLSAGAPAGGISSYNLAISADVSRLWLDGSASGLGEVALTSGDLVGWETISFLPTGTPSTTFLDSEMTLTNFSDVTGTIANPTGTPVVPGAFPLTVAAPSGAVTENWSTPSFGFDVAGDVSSKGTPENSWDEFTVGVTQTWDSVPEPSSAILGLLGAALLCGRRRR